MAFFYSMKTVNFQTIYFFRSKNTEAFQRLCKSTDASKFLGQGVGVVGWGGVGGESWSSLLD